LLILLKSYTFRKNESTIGSNIVAGVGRDGTTATFNFFYIFLASASASSGVPSRGGQAKPKNFPIPFFERACAKFFEKLKENFWVLKIRLAECGSSAYKESNRILEKSSSLVVYLSPNQTFRNFCVFFGDISAVSRIVYALVGLSALYIIFWKFSATEEKGE